MTYSAKLKQVLSYTGKTQTELAGILGVSFPTVNSWIQGKSIPRKKAQEKIDVLYYSCVGNLEVKEQILTDKRVSLSLLQKKHINPFVTIINRKDLYETLLLEMTYHTNSIEGSTFNEPQVKAVLFDDVTIPNKTVREHQEVKNHQGALGFVVRSLQEKDFVITEKWIKRIHEILMNGILHNAGQYRVHGVRIAGSHVATSNYQKIDTHMIELIKDLNKKSKDIALHLAETHAKFEQIHPFSDGNGRVGRLIMLALALRNNLAPVIIKKDYKIAYYNYLQEAQLKGNHIPLTSFIFDALFYGYKLLED